MNKFNNDPATVIVRRRAVGDSYKYAFMKTELVLRLPIAVICRLLAVTARVSKEIRQEASRKQAAEKIFIGVRAKRATPPKPSLLTPRGY